jgi:hypothetical protein
MIIILSILFAIVSAEIDAYLLRKGKRWNAHTIRGIFRLLILFIIAGFDFNHLIIALASFYMIFDYWLNVRWLGSSKWNYIGNTSLIDVFWSVWGWQMQLGFKLLFFTTSINYLL